MNQRFLISDVLAAALLFLTVVGVHGQTDAFDAAETCEGGYDRWCWQELDSHPGCYVWKDESVAATAATWTGPCNGSVFDGLMTWSQRGDGGGTVLEVPYVNGKKHGTEVERYYVSRDNPAFAGKNTLRVRVMPWVNGVKHGSELYLFGNGSVLECRYVNGTQIGDCSLRTD